jgi:putative ABC transport system substrate-binding protein
MPALAADLVRLRPAVIYATNSAAALAAKAATSTIPVVFGTGDDPVTLGLVPRLNRPGGNLTGVTNLNVELEQKRFGMAHEIMPAGRTIAALVDTTNPAAERQVADIQEAARSLGRTVRILRAASEREIDDAFKTIVQPWHAYDIRRRNELEEVVHGQPDALSHRTVTLLDCAMDA